MNMRASNKTCLNFKTAQDWASVTHPLWNPLVIGLSPFIPYIGLWWPRVAANHLPGISQCLQVSRYPIFQQDAVYNCNSDFSPPKKCQYQYPLLTSPKKSPKKLHHSQAVPSRPRPSLRIAAEAAARPRTSQQHLFSENQAAGRETEHALVVQAWRMGMGDGLSMRRNPTCCWFDIKKVPCQVVSSLKSLFFGH